MKESRYEFIIRVVPHAVNPVWKGDIETVAEPLNDFHLYQKKNLSR